MTPEVRAPRDAAEYEAALELRWRILRAPWGQPRGSERDALDGDAVQRVVVEAGRVLATGRLHRLDDATGQIRYMAVEANRRGRGLGRLLLRSLEQAAREAGLDRIVLHAREASVAFYEHAGYRLLGPSHTLYGEIRHWRMEKHLPPNTPANT